MSESADADLLDSPFWKFSKRIYSQTGVSKACLDLQNRFAADVNILLFCKWSAEFGPGRLALGQLRECVDITAQWQLKVVQVLRELRQQKLKQNTPELGDFAQRQLQSLELNAECVEQALLYQWSMDYARPRDVDVDAEAARNLVAYLSLLSVDMRAAADPLRVLLAAK